MPKISESGVFIDSKTGKVVESQPEEGVQIVPPGSEITPDMEKAVEAAKLVESGESEPVAEAVTTEDAKPKRASK